jgi:hypothetical protein
MYTDQLNCEWARSALRIDRGDPDKVIYNMPTFKISGGKSVPTPYFLTEDQGVRILKDIAEDKDVIDIVIENYRKNHTDVSDNSMNDGIHKQDPNKEVIKNMAYPVAYGKSACCVRGASAGRR